jgi:uncharacterized membrane protein
MTVEEKPSSTAASIFKKIHTAAGFQKGYAFINWVVWGGGLFAFTLSRLNWLDIDHKMCPEFPQSDGSTGFPTSCYWIRHFDRYKIGITLHLACYLPAGLLAAFQFVPGIRHRFIWYHRIVGYVCIVLALLGNAGAAMLADTAMGGEMAFSVTLGLVVIGTFFTFSFAIYNIRRKQIDGHRAWMIRTWAYIGYIITIRLVQMTMVAINSRWPEMSNHVAIQCAELRYIYFNDRTLGDGPFTQQAWDAFIAAYPTCKDDSLIHTNYAAVKGLVTPGDLGQTNAAFMTPFAGASALALAINVAIAEIYLWLTPAETERLRRISYQKQLKLGYKNPGLAGLVGFGDQNWTPPAELLPPQPSNDASSAGSVSDNGPVDKDVRGVVSESKV